MQNKRGISTHTPRERRDMWYGSTLDNMIAFQLTRLVRGVTEPAILDNGLDFISTHTPRERRDSAWSLRAIRTA